MTMTLQTMENLKLIVKTINGIMPVSAVYLFGSYANGIPNECSDLDIYIVTPDKSKRRIDWAIQVRKAFGVAVKIPIDVVVNYDDEFERRSKINVSFEHEVATKGINISAY
jgi:predicted nucleotidyltransferase